MLEEMSLKPGVKLRCEESKKVIVEPDRLVDDVRYRIARRSFGSLFQRARALSEAKKIPIDRYFFRFSRNAQLKPKPSSNLHFQHCTFKLHFQQCTLNFHFQHCTFNLHFQSVVAI